MSRRHAASQQQRRHPAKRRTAAAGRPGPGERARRGWIGASRLAAVPMAGLVSERPRRAGYKAARTPPRGGRGRRRAWVDGSTARCTAFSGEDTGGNNFGFRLRTTLLDFRRPRTFRHLYWLSATRLRFLVFSPGYSAASFVLGYIHTVTSLLIKKLVCFEALVFAWILQ